MKKNIQKLSDELNHKLLTYIEEANFDSFEPNAPEKKLENWLCGGWNLSCRRSGSRSDIE